LTVSENHILPDLTRTGLRVIFCGTAAGRESAAKRQYYAGKGNKFWTVLTATGLVPRPAPLRPDQWAMLDEFDIGLTDLAKRHSGADSSLPRRAFDSQALIATMNSCAPRAFAFNGKKAASVFLGHKVTYGHVETRGPTALWVLPSTSGLATRYWNITHWQNLADSLS
jgi:TDG/mug DNA glycosylase family protein